jgi:hypothetical protein
MRLPVRQLSSGHSSSECWGRSHSRVAQLWLNTAPRTLSCAPRCVDFVFTRARRIDRDSDFKNEGSESQETADRKDRTRFAGIDPHTLAVPLAHPNLIPSPKLHDLELDDLSQGMSRSLLNLEPGSLLVDHDIHDGARQQV